MVHSILFLTLLAISSVKAGDFAACANYIFTKAYYNSAKTKIESALEDSTYFEGSGTDQGQFKYIAGCRGIFLNYYNFDFYGPYTGCTSLSEFGLGIWAKFMSTISSKTLIIGDISGNINTFTAHSDTNGVLVFTFSKDGTSKDIDDISITVPTYEWTFLTFYFLGTTLKIYMPGQTEILKTKTGQYDYANPTEGGNIHFDGNMLAIVYQVIGFNKASISADYNIITLTDAGNNVYGATTIANCAEKVCHPTIGSFEDAGDCDTCDKTGCTACGTNGRLPENYCNFICPSYCLQCSPSTVCSVCRSGYFLYDNAAQTSCISCDTSCSACSPGPSCFECADLISQEGSSCKVNKVGYQVSFSSQNIEIDFAHPLVTGLTVSSLIAKTEAGVPIDASKWKLNTCSAGVLSCTIVTDNLSESQLPIDLSLEFNQA